MQKNQRFEKSTGPKATHHYNDSNKHVPSETIEQSMALLNIENEDVNAFV